MQQITAICCAPDQEKKVRPTKVILTLFLLASAITGLLPARPGGSFIQCDPKNSRSPIRCTPDGW
jgi:hypothetical protein